jgi:hypothetical protein
VVAKSLNKKMSKLSSNVSKDEPGSPSSPGIKRRGTMRKGSFRSKGIKAKKVGDPEEEEEVDSEESRRERDRLLNVICARLHMDMEN